MKSYVKEHKKSLAILCILWSILLVIFLNACSDYQNRRKMTDKEGFLLNAEILQKEEHTGANIWLKQTIHGENGIHYRYVIETDCPSWDFETRYMTDTPIDWIDETSAVEVLVYDTQIRYNGTVYASGQYYTVPLLDNISSEEQTLEDWQTSLVNQAWQVYDAERSSDGGELPIMAILLVGLPFLPFLWYIMSENQKEDRKIAKEVNAINQKMQEEEQETD